MYGRYSEHAHNNVVNRIMPRLHSKEVRQPQMELQIMCDGIRIPQRQIDRTVRLLPNIDLSAKLPFVREILRTLI